jgi:diaminopropionate ammonia-lyase
MGFELRMNRWLPPAREFHRGMHGYAPTELRKSPELAAELGVAEVWLKLEIERFGLPAFKILGASWAAERLLGCRAVTLVTATDGNHGRAVARVAAMRGLPAHILVPAGTAQARIDGIASEGAEVEVIEGSYDDAVRRAAELADDDHVVLSDTSWPGYEDVPRWVVEGYSTIFNEIDEQAGAAPSHALIPIGVGSLAVAAANHYAPHTRLIGVEPTDAACALASIRAGEPVEVPGPHRSMMAGLNAGSLSMNAWPVLRDRFSAFCAIDDEWAVTGMRRLAAIGIEAGEVSGGTVGALLATAGSQELGLGPDSRILLLLTEGVTDPDNWVRLVHDSAEGSRQAG